MQLFRNCSDFLHSASFSEAEINWTNLQHFKWMDCCNCLKVKTFVVNKCLKFRTHQHHHILFFHASEALLALCCGHCLVLLVGFSGFSFVFSNWKARCYAEIRWLTWLMKNIPVFAFRNGWVAFVVFFGSLSVCTVKWSGLWHLSEKYSAVHVYQ